MTTTTALKTYEPYQDIRTELAELAVTNDNAVFDYEDPKGAKLAKSHVHSIRAIKGLIERKRKELKADYLEAGRRVDSVAKELTAQVVAMIDVHEAPLKAIEQRETDRVNAILVAIQSIEEAGVPADNTAENLQAAIGRVEAIEIDKDVYQERMYEATEKKDELLAGLKSIHAQAIKQEAEQAELDRLRKESAAREQVEREERIRLEAKQEAEAAAVKSKADADKREAQLKEQAAQAERDKVAAAKKAESDRVAAEERHEKLRIQAIAEAKRIATEELQAKRIAEEAKAEAQRVAAEKKAANVKHREKVISEAAAAIDDLFQTEHHGDDIVSAIVAGGIPHVSVQF